MKIFIIGYMCSGKSTVGKKLARKLNYDFIDLDIYFEEKYHISVDDFFKKYGEEDFRKIETQLLNEVLTKENIVISSGGGTPCFNENMKLMKKNGVSVYLKMHINSLKDRILNSKKQRPLLKNISKDNIHDFLSDHLSKREVFYQQANFTVKGENADVEGMVELFRCQGMIK